MAKVKAPLLSLDARGQLGKAMVFIGWKGLKTVRQHVVPANPQSAAQVAQRNKMGFAVAFWKTLSALDKAAWDRYAPIEPKVMAGANSHAKNSIANQTAETPPPMGINFVVTPGTGDAVVTIDVKDITDDSDIDSLTDVDVFFGTEIRNLASQVNLVFSGGVYSATVPTLTAGTEYFFQVFKTTLSLKLSGVEVGTPT